MSDEPLVTASTPVPPGYIFVKKGNIYITRHCRAETHAANKQVYIVTNQSKSPLGIRVPKHIYHRVLRAHNETLTDRRQAVQRRDQALQETVRDKILKSFPAIPGADVEAILRHILKKRSGRVGRSTVLEVDDIVELGVRAHIRHRYTEYDQIIRQAGKDTARGKVQHAIEAKVKEWGGCSKYWNRNGNHVQDEGVRRSKRLAKEKKIDKVLQKRNGMAKKAATGKNLKGDESRGTRKKKQSASIVLGGHGEEKLLGDRTGQTSNKDSFDRTGAKDNELSDISQHRLNIVANRSVSHIEHKEKPGRTVTKKQCKAAMRVRLAQEEALQRTGETKAQRRAIGRFIQERRIHDGLTHDHIKTLTEAALIDRIRRRSVTREDWQKSRAKTGDSGRSTVPVSIQQAVHDLQRGPEDDMNEVGMGSRSLQLAGTTVDDAIVLD